MNTQDTDFNKLFGQIRDCQLCEAQRLIPKARPIFQISATSQIGIFGQAPGNLAHQAGKPFCDPSGDRLRDWMGVDETTFYDPHKIAIIPMAFCFPGYDGKGKTGKGGDLPPPKLCAETWRGQIMGHLGLKLKLVLLVGQYAQNWHLAEHGHKTLTENVSHWRSHIQRSQHVGGPIFLPMPHPSWRNNGWIKNHPWFAEDLLPWLRQTIDDLLS